MLSFLPIFWGFAKNYKRVLLPLLVLSLLSIPYFLYQGKTKKIEQQAEKIEELEKNITLQVQNQEVAVENGITQSNAERRAKVLEEIKQEIKEFEDNEENETNDATEYNNSIFDRVFFYDQG